MSQIKVFEEHGGILELDTGKALITCWPQQIETSETSKTVIRPISVTLLLDAEEQQQIQKFSAPKDSRYFRDKARSSITDVAYSHLSKVEKAALLKELKKEISSLEKNL